MKKNDVSLGKDDIGHILNVLMYLFFIAVVSYFALNLSERFYNFVKNDDDLVFYLTGITIPLVLSISKESVVRLKSLYKAVTKRERIGYVSDAGSVLYLVFLVGFAIHTSPQLLGLDYRFSLVDVNVQKKSIFLNYNFKTIEGSALASFPFFYKDNAEQVNDVWIKGVSFDEGNRINAEKILNAFSNCAISGKSEVVFSVSGYASYAKFKKGDSDDLNYQAANSRMENAVVEINKIIDENNYKGVVIQKSPWVSYEEMINKRRYSDDVRLKNTNYHEIINRSVFLDLIDAGACDLGYLKKTHGA